MREEREERREREREIERLREREIERERETRQRGEERVESHSLVVRHGPTALPRNQPSSTSAPNAAPASLVRTKPSRLMSSWRRRRRHVKFMFVSQVLGPQNSGAHVSCLVCLACLSSLNGNMTT